MTPKEWAAVERQIDEVREQQAIKELGDLLIAQKRIISQQAKELQDKSILINILEDLNTQRNDKLEKLEATLTKLETELAKLR